MSLGLQHENRKNEYNNSAESVNSGRSTAFGAVHSQCDVGVRRAGVYLQYIGGNLVYRDGTSLSEAYLQEISESRHE